MHISVSVIHGAENSAPANSPTPTSAGSRWLGRSRTEPQL